jgi:4-amino-4-deoxy-L-arabinose transferase-like glycosyltransferase
MMKQLLFWVALSKVFVALIILYSGIGLMPDEAQYWTWSKELSYGYYSKPPGIAWQIAFGTWLFGDTEFGVRFGSIILSFVLSLGIYWLARGA